MMNKQCKVSFDKVKELIEQKKVNLQTDFKPEVHALSSGVLFQYFNDWLANTSISEPNDMFESIQRPIKQLDSNNLFDNVKLCFSKKELIDNYIVSSDRILIMLDGCAEYHNYDTDETKNIDPFSIITMKKGQKIKFKCTCQVNYYLVIDVNLPLT